MRQRTWISNPQQKHYKNCAECGTVFITTTVLDFAPIFANLKLADQMVASLLSDCRHYRANLWAFVVMPTHIHLLLDLPSEVNVSKLMQMIKRNASRRLLPLLTNTEHQMFDLQRGLNRSQIWTAGFRSVQVRTREDFAVKSDYIYWNPVKKGLSQGLEDYRWSSANRCLSIKMKHEGGIVIDDALIAEFLAKD